MKAQMPIIDNVGRSEYTPIKQDHFRTIINMHQQVTSAVLKKHTYFNQTYHYIDATSGPGKYSSNGEKFTGSPLIFLEVANSNKLKFKADFIEEIDENLENLIGNIPEIQKKHCSFHCCTYEEQILQIIKSENKKEFGLLYIDPNTGIPDFDVISKFSEFRPRMEILLYLSATNLKREHGYSDKTLSDYISQMDKRNWVVRKPIKGDNHQWTFLMGSNTELFKDYKSIDFYRMDSLEAQKFFIKLELSKKQQQNRLQSNFFNQIDD